MRTPHRSQIFTGPADTVGRIRAACPRCEAGPGDRCYSLQSWVPLEAGHRDGKAMARGFGMYMSRQNHFHADRPTTRKGPQVSGRELARRELRSLSQSKLSGNARVSLRAWAGSTRRTEEELVAKVAELRAMGDLAW